MKPITHRAIVLATVFAFFIGPAAMGQPHESLRITNELIEQWSQARKAPELEAYSAQEISLAFADYLGRAEETWVKTALETMRWLYDEVEEADRSTIGETLALHALTQLSRHDMTAILWRVRATHIDPATRAAIVDRILTPILSGEAPLRINSLQVRHVLVYGDDKVVTTLRRLRDELWTTPGADELDWYSNGVLSITVALARRGLDEEVEFAIQLADSHPVDVTKHYNIFRQLATIRDMRVVDYIAQYLGDDKPLTDNIPGDDAVIPTRRSSAIDCLAQMLRDFPRLVTPEPDQNPRHATAEEQRAWIASIRHNPPWR